MAETTIQKIVTMVTAYYTTEHRKGQQLLSKERHEIEVQLTSLNWLYLEITAYQMRLRILLL